MYRELSGHHAHTARSRRMRLTLSDDDILEFLHLLHEGTHLGHEMVLVLLHIPQGLVHVAL